MFKNVLVCYTCRCMVLMCSLENLLRWRLLRHYSFDLDPQVAEAAAASARLTPGECRLLETRILLPMKTHPLSGGARSRWQHCVRLTYRLLPDVIDTRLQTTHNSTGQIKKVKLRNFPTCFRSFFDFFRFRN